MDAFESSLKSLLSSGASKWQDLALTNLRQGPNESGTSAAYKKRIFSLVKNMFSTNFDATVSVDTTVVYCASAHHRPRGEDFDSVLSGQDLVPLQKAREFLSFLSCALAKRNAAAMKSLPVLIVCDGNKNRQKIYFLHIHKTSNLPKCDDRDVFEYTVQTISMPGRFHESAMPAVPLSELGRPLVCQPHLFNSANGLGKDCLQNLSVSSFSRYLLFQSSLQMMNKFNLQSKKSYITIDVSSLHAEKALECASGNMSTAVINVCPIPGDIRSPAFKLYKDLNMIEGLLEVFGPEKQIQWRNTDVDEMGENSGINENEGPILDQVNNILNTFGLQQKKKGDKKETDEYAAIFVQHEADFTEALWRVLKKVQGVDELMKCLNRVVCKICSGGNHNFWIHSDNRTRLAKLVKSAYEGPISPPSLKGLQAVCMLIEIGIDRMERDYMHFFGQHHTLHRTQLKQHFKKIPTTGGSEEEKLNMRFEILLKFHHVLELSVKCRAHFSQFKKRINKVVESGLNSYLDTDVDFNRVFSIDVTYKDVETFISVAQRQLWRAVFNTENRNGKSTAIMCWTNEFPLRDLVDDYIKTPTPKTDDDDENDVGKNYYLTTLKQSIHVC